MTMATDLRVRTLGKVIVSAVMFCTATLTLIAVSQDGHLPLLLQSESGSIGIYVLLMVFCGYLVRTCWKREEAVNAGDASLWRVVATFFSAMALLMFVVSLAYYAWMGR
jgi:hypothetical protein